MLHFAKQKFGNANKFYSSFLMMKSTALSPQIGLLLLLKFFL